MYDVQMSAEQQEKTIKQMYILSFFSKTSNKNSLLGVILFHWIDSKF